MQHGTSTLENSWVVSIKSNIYLPYNQSIPLLGTYTQDENSCSYKNLYVNVHSSFSHNHRKLEKTPITLTYECINKRAHQHHGILLSNRMEHTINVHNMEKPEMHYAKYKSQTQRLHTVCLM